MRTFTLLCAFSLACCAAIAGPDGVHDRELAIRATNIKALHRVTDKPHPLLESTARLCRVPSDIEHNLHEGVSEPAYCNIYVNDLAKPIMQSGQGTYPVGSLIVKSKLHSKDKPDIELFTVMHKLAEGYDKPNGNWEYSIIDGRTQRVLASGRIDSCVACHTEYRKTDYVTRLYMPKTGTEIGEKTKSR